MTEMSREARVGIGALFVALLLGLAALPVGVELGTWVLAIVAVLVVVGVVAPWVPSLNRLPVVGARTSPPVTVNIAFWQIVAKMGERFVFVEVSVVPSTRLADATLRLYVPLDIGLSA